MTESLLIQAGIELAAWEHEARAPDGRWVHGAVHAYDLPDPDRLINKRSPYPDPASHPFFQRNPVSPQHIAERYDETSPEERQQGMRWYQDAQEVARSLGNGDLEKGAGLLSAYSPQTSWPVNMLNAARSMAKGRAIGPGEGMITRQMQATAQKVMDGGKIPDVFKSPKTLAFARLIRHGADPADDRLGNVVIDRHALSVAVGRRLSKDDVNGSPIGDARYYQHVADQYRLAAAAISKRDGRLVTPHQLQAITWLHQQEMNQEADAEAGRAGSGRDKGRGVMIRNAWAGWQHWDWQHNVPTEIGTTSMPGGAIAEEVRHSPEGFSVSMASGKSPHSGYMVAVNDHTHTFPASVMDSDQALADAIDQMLMSEPGVFGQDGMYLGGWVHDGKLWLEPSRNIADRQQAEQLAAQDNQIAIWDVAGGQEIQTGGSGGGSVTEHGAHAQGHHGAGPGGLQPAASIGAQAGLATPGRPAPAGTEPGIGRQFELTGDGHGHHVPGTPVVYRHGWKPVSAQPASSLTGAMSSMTSEEHRAYSATGFLPERLHSLAVSPVPVQKAPHGTLVEEQRRLLTEWTHSYRYSNSTTGSPRTAEFINELHKVMTGDTTPSPPSPGREDAHNFLAMVKATAKPVPAPVLRGLSVQEADFGRLFAPGSTVDLPLLSWTKNAVSAHAYAARTARPGKIHIIMHAPAGGMGLELKPILTGGGSWLKYQAQLDEVITGGRYPVERIEWIDGAAHVYLGQQEDFRAR